MRLSPALLSLLTALGAHGAHGDVAPAAQPVAASVAHAAGARWSVAGADVATAEPTRARAFYFSRALYTGAGRGRGGWGGSWATDYPKADLQFLTVLQRLLPTVDAHPEEHALALTDPALRRYPYLYAVEVGYMALTDEEVAGLRQYLLAGGFLFVDDFWGTREWASFEAQLRRVLPGRPVVELGPDHPVFTTYYQIDRVVQVPSVNNACRGWGTSERDGTVPSVRGVFDDEGRLMVLISFNSDLGDAWEWAERSCYPLEYSTYAFQLAVNTIVYAMSR